MQKVEFKYDIFKDGWNIFRVLTQAPTFDVEDKTRVLNGLKAELADNVNKEEDPLVKQQIITEYLFKFVSQNKKLINEKINSFTGDWEKINNDYFERLSRILNIKIPQKAYVVYLTNAGSCPFNANENWLMARIRDEKVDAVIAHEIMHIEFIKAYYLYCKNAGLSPKEFGDLKESLTVLLNEEMSDILSRLDYGYEEHQELRKKISELWKQNKNFNFLLDNIIKFMLKDG